MRAYDPSLGRFLSRDPLGRAPLVGLGWSSQPYVYAGNNPLVNVDPSGQRFAAENAAQTRAAVGYAKRAARMYPRWGPPPPKQGPCGKEQWCWAHKYSQNKFSDGLGAFLLGLGVIAGVIAGYFNGIGPLLDMLFHSQIVNAIHWLVRGAQEMWEGIFGPLTASTKAYFDIAALLGDLAVFVLGLVDGWRDFNSVDIGEKFAGKGIWVRLQRIFLKLKNLIFHDLNRNSLKPLLGDIGGLLVGGLPQMIGDWNTFATDARGAWGWDLWIVPCPTLVCNESR